jgi:hypothetical protein
MVNGIELKQKTIPQELEDHSNGDKAFILGASYILEVCSRDLVIFNEGAILRIHQFHLLDTLQMVYFHIQKDYR